MVGGETKKRGKEWGLTTAQTYLDIAKHIVLDGREGDGAQGICILQSILVRVLKASQWRDCTKHGGQGLGSVEELGGGDGIVLVSVDGNVGEGLLEGVEKSTAGRNSRHFYDLRTKIIPLLNQQKHGDNKRDGMKIETVVTHRPPPNRPTSKVAKAPNPADPTSRFSTESRAASSLTCEVRSHMPVERTLFNHPKANLESISLATNQLTLDDRIAA